jgi:hypothetical protein
MNTGMAHTKETEVEVWRKIWVGVWWWKVGWIKIDDIFEIS